MILLVLSPWARRLVLLGLFTAPSQVAAKCTLGYVATLKLTVTDDRIYTDVRIGDITLPMILDTGSNISMMSLADSRKVYLRVMPTKGSLLSSDYMHGIGGDREGAMMYAPHAHIGDINAPDMRFMVPDGNREGRDSDLLGMNPFTAFDIDLDLIGRRMVLFENQGGCSKPPVLMGGPTYIVPKAGDPEDTHTYIYVTLAGKSLLAVLDTGAHSTAITSSAAERVGLTRAVLAGDPRMRARGIGAGTVEGVRHLSAPISIGGLTVQNVHVAVIDTQLRGADMLLGMDFLTHVHTWISNSTHTVVFQVPPTASPPLP